MTLYASLSTITLACLLAATGALAAGQTSSLPDKDDLFAGTEKFAQGASSVTEINMDPNSLSEVRGKDSLRARTTLLNVVHTYEYDKPGMYKIEDVEAFRKKLNTGDWHCSVHTREMKTGESTDVCSKRRGDELTEQAIITVEPKSLTFIHTIRKVSPRSDAGAAMPLTMGLAGPEIQAEMAVAQAELQAQLAALKPLLDSRQLDEWKNFKGPDPAEMKRLQEELRKLDLKTIEPDQKPR